MNMRIEPRITFKEAIVDCFKKMKQIKGRSRRSEFWNFYLLFILELIIFFIVLIKLKNSRNLDLIMSLLYMPVLFSFIALTTASIRRLHDTERSGFYLLIYIVPLFGFYYLMHCFAEDSDKKSNKYGPSPKYCFIDTGNALINYNQIGQINMMPNMQPDINNQNINQNQIIQLNGVPQIINSQGINGGNTNVIPNCNINRINQPQMPFQVINENYEPGIYQNI